MLEYLWRGNSISGGISLSVRESREIFISRTGYRGGRPRNSSINEFKEDGTIHAKKLRLAENHSLSVLAVSCRVPSLWVKITGLSLGSVRQNSLSLPLFLIHFLCLGCSVAAGGKFRLNIKIRSHSDGVFDAGENSAVYCRDTCSDGQFLH